MMVKPDDATRSHARFLKAGRLLLAACLLISFTTGAGVAAPPTATGSIVQAPDQVAAPYLLMENIGQYAQEARFLLKQGNRHVWLTGDAVWLTAPDPVGPDEQATSGSEGRLRQARRPGRSSPGARSGTAIRFTFPGANPAATLEPFGRVPTRVSYLIGDDPARWQRDVPVWSGVRYRDLYPGVDLVIGDDTAGAVPWRLEAGPGADLQAVTLRVEGAGATAAEPGRLRLEMKGRTVGIALPVWTVAGGPDLAVSTITGQAGEDAFILAPQGDAAPEPAIGAGTYGPTGAEDLIYGVSLGGTAYDSANGIAIDHLGNAYVTGETQSGDFPVIPGSYDPTHNGASGSTDAFIAKYNATGTALLYATYLGGTATDIGWDIAVGGTLAYVVGETASPDFPYRPRPEENTDIFVAVLNDDGSDLRYVTRLIGSGFDTGSGIAVEGLDAYVVGTTDSTDLPGANCVGNVNGNLVVARLDPVGSPAYITCLGGSGFEAGSDIAVRSGAAYVTGQSFSNDFPGPSGPLAAVSGDILVARFLATGPMSNATLIGGSGEDSGSGIALDGIGNIYVAGTTGSSVNFPGTAPITYGGGPNDAVIVKLLPTFTRAYAAYLGGNGEDYGSDIVVDTVQGMYVAGTTSSTNFPATAGAYDPGHNGGFDVFVARLHLASSEPNKITYATYLGAANDDWGYGIATDTGGHAFVTGSRASTGDQASVDALVARLRVNSPLGAPAVTISPGGTNAYLDWPDVSLAFEYQVFRSSAPYFIPGDWSSLWRLAEGPNSYYSDVNALTPVNAYFYVVKTTDDTPAASTNSNRVGKFTFQLVPGGN